MILPQSLESVGKSAFAYQSNMTAALFKSDFADMPADAFYSHSNGFTIYGMHDGSIQEYAEANGINFIPLNYPMIEPSVTETAPGKECTFTATVYTGINQSTTDVSWEVKGNTSSSTLISTEGVLKTADDEKAETLTVSAIWGDAVSEATVTVLREFYTITYHLDGGENNPANPEVYPVTDKSVSLLPPVKEHYDFAGWFRDEQFETSFTDETECSGDLDLYAKWTPAKYCLTFDVNGGEELEEASKEVIYNEPIGELPVCLKDGYEFIGWFLSADGSDMVNEDTVCEGDMTVYAHWMEQAVDHEHDYEGTVLKEPTCTEDGVRVMTCKLCDSSYEEAIPATGHLNTELRGAQEATCTSEGYSGDTYCLDCEELIEEGEVIEMTDHSWAEEYTIDEAATCQKEGSESIHCTVCGTVKEGTETVIPKADHEWDEGTITSEASCTEAGIMEFTCGICQETRTEEIPMIEHEWGEFTQKSPATCTEAEILEHVCARCGELEETEGAEATGHINVSVNGAKEPTCTEVGYTGETFCNDCETVISASEEIPATGHTSEKVAGKAATCTETGLTEGAKCSVCGEIITAQKDIPAKGHAYGKWKTVKEPTYNSEGLEQRVCANDSTHVETRTIDKLINVTPETEADISQAPSVDKQEKEITNQKTDGDPANSMFGALQAKATPLSNTSIKVEWKKVKGATKYIVYGNKCGKTNKLKKLKTTTATTFTQKKLAKGTYYKYLVVAVKSNKAISTSKMIHATTNGGKYGNATRLTVSKTSVSLKKGGKCKLTVKVKNNKTAKKHREVAFESSNTNIAKVGSKGTITGNRKGTCYIYVYAQNGLMKKVKVTVK